MVLTSTSIDIGPSASYVPPHKHNYDSSSIMLYTSVLANLPSPHLYTLGITALCPPKCPVPIGTRQPSPTPPSVE